MADHRRDILICYDYTRGVIMSRSEVIEAMMEQTGQSYTWAELELCRVEALLREQNPACVSLPNVSLVRERM